MVDDGELDWKIIAIRTDDPKAAEVNDVEDIERVFPGELEKIRTWFTNYKIPDGKPASEFGYDGKCLNKEFAMEVIEGTHGFYNDLQSGVRENTEEFFLTGSSDSANTASSDGTNTGKLFLVYLIAFVAFVYNF
jgi:inorganic pyrophosphatase